MNVHAKEWPWPTAPDLPRREVDPIVLQIVEGTLNSIEAEIEYAIERTARSPMIREAHDYRVGLFDRYSRKLTGRSYSAIVEPVFEYFGVDDIHPGDVFFWNDPYNSSGGIGHVPDLCTTVPIFYGDRLIGFSQVFGHHDDVGGSVPGSLPVHATDSWMEGLLVPPIKLYERGKRNEAAFRIIPTAEYDLWSDEFVRSVERINKGAKDKNLEQAKLGYLSMTLACFNCHTYVRDQKRVSVDTNVMP